MINLCTFNYTLILDIIVNGLTGAEVLITGELEVGRPDTAGYTGDPYRARPRLR